MSGTATPDRRPAVPELAHAYGDRVHVLDDPFLHALLARIGRPDLAYPDVLPAVEAVYRVLFALAAGDALPRANAAVDTRMRAQHPDHGVWRGALPDPATRAVVVDVVRGGILPAQHGFELLALVLPPEQVRLDHLVLSRRADEAGRVVGVDLAGAKVGGSVEGAVLFVPDPMGATGSTMRRLLDHYLEHHGRPARVVSLPMIATPEFLAAMEGAPCPVDVWTARLDRGLSAADVLATPPGTHWDRERGLDDHGYIVPGAGGVGEVLNNSWC